MRLLDRRKRRLYRMAVACYRTHSRASVQKAGEPVCLVFTHGAHAVHSSEATECTHLHMLMSRAGFGLPAARALDGACQVALKLDLICGLSRTHVRNRPVVISGLGPMTSEAGELATKIFNENLQ